jgi:iron(III) transport system permease protein
MPIIVYRVLVLGITALAVVAPIALVVYQSFLTAPFFDHSARLSLYAFSFVFQDPDFWDSFWTTVALCTGMVAIAVPLGALLAFLMVRTDMPARQYLEPAILSPIFISAVVIAFGYVVAIGPVGIFSTLAKDVFGFVPWNRYSLT